MSVTINEQLLPLIISEYFTTSTPILNTTSSSIELSLILKAGPRYITAYNDVNQTNNIGSIQDEEGANNYVQYPSPKTFEWNIGSTHNIQTPLPLLDASNNKYKYKNWFKKGYTVPIQDNFLRGIQVPVGLSDEIYSARFDLAKHIQISNSLEGGLSGGTVTYESTTLPTYESYDYYSSTQTHTINSSVPNGTLGKNWTFYKWSDGSTSQARTILLNTDVNLIASYKGNSISNTQNAFANTNQRKILRTPDGNFHLVYESMGNVWYERSSDNGNTWQLMNNGKPLNNSPAKQPAIDYCGGPSTGYIGIVFQEQGEFNYYKIKVDLTPH